MNEDLFDNARRIIDCSHNHRPTCCIGPTGATGPTGV